MFSFDRRQTRKKTKRQRTRRATVTAKNAPAALGAPDGSEHVLPRDVPSPDVVQVSVICLADQRVNGLDILRFRAKQA
jgi:hypothetical protein